MYNRLVGCFLCCLFICLFNVPYTIQYNYLGIVGYLGWDFKIWEVMHGFYANIALFCFGLRFILFIWEVELKGGKTEIFCLLIHSPNGHNCQEWARLEARRLELHPGLSHVAGRYPDAWNVFHCFPGVINRALDPKWSSQTWTNVISYGGLMWPAITSSPNSSIWGFCYLCQSWSSLWIPGDSSRNSHVCSWLHSRKWQLWFSRVMSP